MVIPAEYGPLTVGLWLAVAAALGMCALGHMLRRQTVPMTLLVVTVSMAIGGIAFFPGTYMNHSVVNILKLFTIFIVLDLMIVSLVLRFRNRPVAA
ncbi:hypothetical protein [Deinococcus humi]|uniref:Uncharacterized membrane protein YcaP (DUF421 family) n=1 Tax=Deinococcus humi TaxID=662880 RepID=A0A7W8JWM4_9DEIO|nr:hypothetical protein [Deinococcus humi]MBB5364345.1 uncharacterized membrane protein YcaP (DUF421 family) [Deinococcus humi]GGO33472.1 hypothetical protein GCM10008949_32690 [Deinococcus humi]